MAATFTTRDEFRHWLQEATSWIAAFCIGAAIIVSITVILLPLGMWLVASAAGVFLMGWLVSWLVPALWCRKAVPCPYCGRINQVRGGIRRFECGDCTQTLMIARHQGRSKGVLTLVMRRKKALYRREVPARNTADVDRVAKTRC